MSESSRETEINEAFLFPDSFAKARPYFEDTASLFSAYAYRMGKLHPMLTRESCDGCGSRKKKAALALLIWEGAFHSKRTWFWAVVGVAGGDGKYEALRFETNHTLCAGCFRGIKYRRWVEAILNKIFFILIFVGIPIGGTAFLLTLVSLFRKDMEGALRVGPAACLLLGLAALGWKGAVWASKWVVPRSLRFIAKFPFKVVSEMHFTKPLFPEFPKSEKAKR